MACLTSALENETGTIFTSTFLLNLGVNCNSVLNEKHFSPGNWKPASVYLGAKSSVPPKQCVGTVMHQDSLHR